MTKKEKKELALKLKAEIDSSRILRGELQRKPEPKVLTIEEQREEARHKLLKKDQARRRRNSDEMMGTRRTHNKWDFEKW